MELIVENLVFGYNNERTVLNGISLHTKSNDVVAIVGASGCGKSTFLRLLCGLIKKNPTNYLSGHISIDGQSPEEFTKKGNVGFMFQEPALFPNLSVINNIRLPLRVKKQRFSKTPRELVSLVGLSKFKDYLPKELSGGMKTRVALARTFITDPSLLLLDEPFSSLDIKWKFLLYKELEILRREYSCTIVLVTHDIQEALLLSNHILVFGESGKIIKELRITKKLPRVFQSNGLNDLHSEYLIIQNSIISGKL